MKDWAVDRIDDWRDSSWFERLAFLGVTLVGFVVVMALIGAVYNERDISGTVVDKEFTAAHYVSETQCAPNAGGNGGCTMVTTQRYVGDDWSVTIDPDDGSSTVYRSVAESYWTNVNIGDRWVDQ